MCFIWTSKIHTNKDCNIDCKRCIDCRGNHSSLPFLRFSGTRVANEPVIKEELRVYLQLVWRAARYISDSAGYLDAGQQALIALVASVMTPHWQRVCHPLARAVLAWASDQPPCTGQYVAQQSETGSMAQVVNNSEVEILLAEQFDAVSLQCLHVRLPPPSKGQLCACRGWLRN